MTEIAPSASCAAGTSLELSPLSENAWRHEPRPVSSARISRQMELFSRMTERLGVAAPDRALTHAVMREAELGCLECATLRRCRQWLDGNSPDDDYRDFCPNEGFLAVLPRQGNVRTELGRMLDATVAEAES